MGKTNNTLTIFLILVACSGYKRDPIIVPQLSNDFYASALSEINSKLKGMPDDPELVEQKLYYCELLNWPTSCESALDSYRLRNGMTYQLVERYIAYYQRHERHALLLAIIEEWNEKYQLEEKFVETYIRSLARSGRSREAVVALREYMKTRSTKEELAFAAEQYLTIGSKPMSLLTLGRLYDLDPSHPLIWTYGTLLFEIGQIDKGIEVLDKYLERSGSNAKKSYRYAEILREAGRYGKARSLLPFNFTVDSMAMLYADLYQKERLFDSAAYVLETYRKVDSTAREPVWELGKIYEQKGWYGTAASYFSLLIQLDPADSIAQQKLNEVQRKIAYLQRQKAEEEHLPVLQLKPKTIENE